MAVKPEKLLWLDLEMTGLDPENDRITEVGLIITDFDFKEIATYEAVIKQDDAVLERMKNAPWYDWSSGTKTQKGTIYDMATSNGLLDKIRDGRSEKDVENEVAELVNTNFNQPAVLAGNSIYNDRIFIRQWWPKVEDKLHYRLLDVTTLKVWMQGSGGEEFVKPDKHRALEDIRGSIEEFRYYLRKLAD